MASEFLKRMAAQEQQNTGNSKLSNESVSSVGAADSRPNAVPQPSAFLLQMVKEEQKRNAAAEQTKRAELERRLDSAALQKQKELESYKASEEYKKTAPRIQTSGTGDLAADAGAYIGSILSNLFQTGDWKGDTKAGQLRAEVDYLQGIANDVKDQSVVLMDMQKFEQWPEEDRKDLLRYLDYTGRGTATGTLPALLSGATAAKDRLDKKYGRETVRNIIESYSRKLNEEDAEATRKAGQENASLLESILTVPVGIAGSALATSDYLGSVLKDVTGVSSGRFSGIDPNTPGAMPGIYTEAVRQKETENVKDWAQAAADAQGADDKTQETLGKVATTVYTAGIDALDNVTRVAMTGGVGSLALAATSSFSSAVRQATVSGASAQQAVAFGFVSAASEVLTEKLPLDNLLGSLSKAGSRAGILSILKESAKQAGIELVTEELNLIAGIAAEALILQGSSDYRQTIAQLVEQGVPYAEAVRQANNDLIQQAGQTALQSGLSGFMTSAGTGIVTNMGASNFTDAAQQYEQDKQNVQEKVEQAIPGLRLPTVDTGTKNNAAVPQTQTVDVQKGENESQSGVATDEVSPDGSTISVYNSADSNESAVEPAVPGLRLQAVDADNQNNAGVTQTQAIDTQKGESVTQKQGLVTQDRAVGTENISVAEQLRRQNMNGGTENVSINGQSAGLAAAGNAETAGAGAGLLHGSSQRLDGAGTAEPTESMAGGAEQAAQRQQSINQQRAAVDRRNRIRSLRIAKISSAELGIQSGTDARNIQLVPQEHWDAEMGQLAERIYQETGKSVSYVMGSIQVRGADGRVRNVNGVISGDNIVVRADHLRLSMEQIADHEAYHGRVDFFGDRLNQEIRRRIIETYSEEEFRSVLTKYVEALRGVYNAEDVQTGEDFAQVMKQVQEEVFADAYAGINAFGAGADRFTTAVNERMEQLGTGRYRSQEQENGVRETNGPPAEESGQKENTAGDGGERYSVEDNAENEYLQAANLTAEELKNGRTVQQFIDQVSGMVNKAVRSKRKLKIGSVSQQHAQVVNDIMHRINPDFSAEGYELWIDGTGASHIEDRHGENGKQDKSMASDEAKMLIPWASQNASGGDFLRDSNGNIRRSVRYFNRDQSRAPEIYLEKQIDNDTVYVSECVPDSENKRIWITSAYIKKGSNGQMLNMEETSPQLTPKAPFDGNATNPIVATPEQSVKEESAESEYLTDEQFRERYGLKLRAVDEVENDASSQTLDETQSQGEQQERFSVDDSDTTDFASVQAAMNAQSKEWNEMYLRNQLGDDGYEQYRKWEKEQQDQKKQETKERTKQRTAEKRAARKSATKPVAESRPTEAKRDLRNHMMNLFSIPEGSRAELGAVIDSYADRLIKNGELTEEDRKRFFDRMYDAGVMTVPAEDYFTEARDILRGGRVYVPEGVRADFGDDWNDIRRRAFGAGIYFTSDPGAGGIDSWNHELASELPGLFDWEETDMRSILERIVEIAEEGRDEKMSLTAYTAMLAEREYISEDEFLDSMERQMDWALRTFAEKARLEVKLRDRTGIRIAKERAEHQEMAQRQRDRKELRQLQEKTLKALQWLNKNRNRAPEELKETWEEVLGDIDLYAIGAANEMRWSDKYNATWKDLAQMYKDAMKNDPNFLPSKELEMIISRLDGAKIADMDLGALNDLYKAAIGMRTEFYNRNNVISDEMQRLFAEVYTDAKNEIEAAPGKYTGKKLDKLMNLDQLTPMNVLQRMGGWDPNGAFYSMARQLEKGERDMRAYSVKAKRMLQDFLTEHADWVKKADGQGKDGIWYEIEVPELMELGMGDKPIFGDTVKVYMTPAQKVHMYLESKNVDNLRHMTGGRTFADKKLYSEGERQEALAQGRTIRMAPETVKAIVSDLTAEEMELARLLEQYYNSFATQEINRISNVLYGYDKAMGKNYAPIYTNRNYTKAEFGVFDQTAEGVGNLKGRQYAVNPSYNISAFDAFERHVDQTSRFVGMAIPARNWTTLMNWREKNNSTGDVITHKWGEEGKKYITDLITTLQAGDDVRNDTVSNSLAKLQSTYITAIFGANPSIVLKQLGSIPLASAYLDARNVPSAVQVKNIDRSLISKYTQDLEWRTMGYSMPETKHLKDNPNWTQTNKFYGFVFGGDAITAMDGWAASVLWPWAENKVRRDHPDLEVGTKEQIDKGESPFYKKVAELFEDALARSQSTSDEIHQGSLRKSKNPITRAFTLFRSDSAQTYNTLRQKIGEAQYYARTGADDKVKTAAKKAVGAAFVSLALNAMWAESINFLMALWKNKGKHYRDEEEKLTLQSVLGEMVSGMLGSFAGVVTFGEEIFEVIGNLLTGEKIYDIETPGMEQLNDLITSISTAGGSMREIISGAADVAENGGNVWKYFKDNSPDILGSIKDLVEKVVMYLPGLPASGIPVSNIEGYLLGAVKWLSSELGTAYDDLFASVDKSDLSGLEGDALKSRLGRILRDRGATDSDETVQELAALYEAGHKSAVPSATPDSVTVDGEKRELGTYQQQVYEKIWSGIVADVLDEIIASDGYADADTEGRAKILSRLYSYAAEKAKAELFDDYEISTAAEKIDAAKEGGELTADCFVTEDYKDLVDAGLESEDAYDLIDRIEEAIDNAGDDGIESIDKWRICVNMFRDSSDQLAALSMVMTPAQLEKAEMANEYGVNPEAYVSFYEIRKNYDADGNNRYTQAEVKAAIDSMGNRCTAEQKAVLWQLATGSTSAKNNPYSSAVGQKIIDAKQAAKDAEAELPRLILGGG